MRRLILSSALVAVTLSGISPQARAETITFENEMQPYPGMRILERRTSNPSWRIRVAFISLCTNGIHVDARSAQAARITPETWGAATGVQLAVNGDFFLRDRSLATVYGDAVGGGMRWPTVQTGLASDFADDYRYDIYGWIAFGPGWVEFMHTEYVKLHADELGVTQGWFPNQMTHEIPKDTYALVSGCPELVVEGQALSEFPDRTDTTSRHARTAMGLTEDRSTFILAVVDGPTAGSDVSVGMTGAELATLMAEMGAFTAFNLDGGGSTQMWLDVEGFLNVPSDGAPRAVGNLWGIFAGTGHGKGQEPGSCFKPGGCFPSALPSAAGSRFGDMPESDDDFSELALAIDEGFLDHCQVEPQKMACPSCSLTRREAVLMVVRASDLDVSQTPAQPSFSDFDIESAGYAEIEAAAAAGWPIGCGGGKLCPDEAATRGTLAGILAKARNWHVDPPQPSFTDVSADDDAFAAVEGLAAHCSAVLGCSGSAFCPDDTMLRSDAAAMVVKTYDLDSSGGCKDDDPSVTVKGLIGCGVSQGGNSSLGMLLFLTLVLLRRNRNTSVLSHNAGQRTL